MYSVDIAVTAVTDITDLTEELYYKIQNVEAERLKEYCYTINESATESAKNVREGVKTMFAKLMDYANDVFEEDFDENLRNPLMIDLVVRSILKYLPNSDLRCCRHVSRLWNIEASSYLRQKQRIVFYPESVEKIQTFTTFVKNARRAASALASASALSIDFSKDNDNGNGNSQNQNSDNPNPSLSEKTSTFYSYKGPPFSTYCITAQFPRTQFPRRLMQDFAATCGQYVKKLEIFYPDDGLLTPENFVRFFITGLPHLESIHLVNLPHSLTQSSFLPMRPHSHQHFHTSNKDNKSEPQLKIPLENSQDSQEPPPPQSVTETETQLKNFQQSAVTQLRIDRTWRLETSWSQDFLQDVMRLMPNLIEYELWTWNSTTEDEHSMPYFLSLSSKNISSLRTLRPGSIGDTLGMRIADLGLNLRKLQLPVLNNNVSAGTIEGLLESQRFTLEEFQLNCSTMQDSRFFIFPRMEKLEELHMIITYPWNNDFATFTPPINYTRQFPRLKVLKMELAIYNDFGFIHYFFPNISADKDNDNDNERTICCSLQELDISFSGFRDEKFITGLASIFPNLVKLRLDGYGCMIFSSIFLHMQNLQELELYLIYGFNVDDQMTGIPKDCCARIRKQGNNNNKLVLDEMQIFPSLNSLINLRKLAIRQKDYQTKFWPDAQCITDVTGYYALAYMKQLRSLQIESVKFTDECKMHLTKTLEDCWLTFN